MTDVFNILDTPSSGGSGKALRGSAGANCLNNSITPTTQYDLDADQISLTDSNDNPVVINNPSLITCNILTAGPIINGRDQVAAFSASSWLHFYWIHNGSTLASIVSLTDNAVGPALPSGYIHWAYAGAVRLDSGGSLLQTIIKSDIAYYDIGIGPGRALSAGTSTVYVSVNLSTLVPNNALFVRLIAQAILSHSVIAVTFNVNLRIKNSINTVLGNRVLFKNTVPSVSDSNNIQSFIPIIDNAPSVEYSIDNVPDISGGAYIDVIGYVLPNGG